MGKIFEGLTEIRMAGDLKEAVALAEQEARPGETVLFSPACASFDMFRDYEERGEKFMDLVRSP
ncbi:MAG: hypothetical protein HY466_04270 [Deltaproteobacteria bacterium]|nr:hypothetical protein [Deltaproteobacteria bacterium]